MKNNKEKKQKSSPPSPGSAPDQPVDDLIAALAYTIWAQEGRPEGREVEHWLQAETQLRCWRCRAEQA